MLCAAVNGVNAYVTDESLDKSRFDHGIYPVVLRRAKISVRASRNKHERLSVSEFMELCKVDPSKRPVWSTRLHPGGLDASPHRNRSDRYPGMPTPTNAAYGSSIYINCIRCSIADMNDIEPVVTARAPTTAMRWFAILSSYTRHVMMPWM